MKTLTALALGAAFLAATNSLAFAERAKTHATDETMVVVEPIARLPQYNSVISAWYKAAVYDPQEKKLGEIEDMLVNADGSITAAMLSVGGFLGIDEKNVAVPLNVFVWTKRDDKTWLALNTTKDALTHAVGYKFDKKTMRWDVKGE